MSDEAAWFYQHIGHKYGTQLIIKVDKDMNLQSNGDYIISSYVTKVSRDE